MRYFSGFILLLTMSCSSQADCWVLAGQRYQIEPELLQAIAIVESGLNQYALNKNNNGTVDIGLMQINSSHFPLLKQYNITDVKLRDDPCQNVIVGAWLLADNFRRQGYNWDAVGMYNVGNGRSERHTKLRNIYIRKIAKQYRQLKRVTYN